MLLRSGPVPFVTSRAHPGFHRADAVGTAPMNVFVCVFYWVSALDTVGEFIFAINIDHPVAVSRVPCLVRLTRRALKAPHIREPVLPHARCSMLVTHGPPAKLFDATVGAGC